jgi:hypothetical protein
MLFKIKMMRQRSKNRKRKSKPVIKKCDHSRNFSCSQYTETVINNGDKKQSFMKYNKICKCYDCGLEWN